MARVGRGIAVTAAVTVLVVVGACAPAGDTDPSVAGSPSPSPTPAHPPRFRFAVIGDYGSGSLSQHNVADRMCEWREDHPFDDVVTTGDNVYPDGSEQYFQQKFFAPYSCLLDAGVAFHASLGNHDYVTRRGGDVLDEPAFGMPKRNYVHREGGVRFVVVDSNELDRGWLSDALRPRTADRWTVVAFHHPVYSTGLHGSTPGYRPSLPRLFERRGVDLVLNGHDHLYMATRRLRRIAYVVTGGGGVSLYDCGRTRWFVARCVSRNHFLYVVAGSERIRLKAVPPSGEPFHRFSTMGR
jgi:hypothetical protein